MNEYPTIDGLRQALDDHRRAGKTVGFVPTMGALHDGHLSLARRAAAECDVVVMSIFVNPLQFGDDEDLARYPRTIERDRELAEAVGVSCLFTPDVSTMYPDGALLTKVSVADITRTMEGALRPSHFDGVATVVAKLFSIVGASRAYFGEKDWQQLAVVKRMAADLSMPVEVVSCATVREPDGLALSSRNAHLSEAEREAALSLSKALFGAQSLINQGETSVAVLSDYMMDVMNREPLVIVVNYAEAVDENLKFVTHVDANSRLLVSAKIGAVNLIDNIGIST